MVPLLFPLVVLISGILAGPHLSPNPVWMCLPLSILLGIARRPLLLLPVFLLGVGLRSAVPTVPPDPGIDAVRLVGRVARAPNWRGLGVYLDVQILRIDGRPYRGRARLTEFLDNPEQIQLFQALDIGTGDQVEIVVALRRPSRYRDPGVFDFRQHLEHEGIYWTGTIRNTRLITVLGRGWHGPDRIHRWVEDRISRHFDDVNTRGLVMGMVLGRTAGLSAETQRQFQAGGVFHLVVVSGFNIAVIAAGSAWIGHFITRRRGRRLILILITVTAYTLLVGWQMPVVRAAIMACVFIAGRALDRGHSPLNVAALSAFVLLLIEPLAITDQSFQMTFAAVIAVLGIGMPAIEWVFERWNLRLRQFDNIDRDGLLDADIADWRVSRRMWCELYGLPHVLITAPLRGVQLLCEAFLATIGVEAIFIYFMVESFHRMAPVSPFLNVPAGLIAAAITPLGLLLIVLPRMATLPVAWGIRALTRILLWTLRTGLGLPHASFRVPSAHPGVWMLYGTVLLMVIFAIHRRLKLPCVAGTAVAAGILTVMVVADFSPKPPQDVVVTILDVGQGDSILVEFPDGRRMLIDGGGVAAGRFLGLRDESTFSIGEDVVSAYLFSRRIRRLDALVLTHAHNDHLDGLFDVVANFRIGTVWLGMNPMIPSYQAFLGLLQERRIPIRWVSAGDRIGEFTVLHPPADYRVRKTAQNNDSVVLLLNTGRQTALFTGDLEMAIKVPEFVNVLKVPHHGSGGTKLRVRSDVRIISVGANNPFGHPAKSVLPALRTDQLGAIQVTLSGERPVVEQSR
jgi:competence protein ComEC